MAIAILSQFLAKIRQQNPDQARAAKLQQMFRVKNQVRNLRNGRVFTVHEADYAGALLEDVNADEVFILNWVSSAGRIRTEVADQWELAFAA